MVFVAGLTGGSSGIADINLGIDSVELYDLAGSILDLNGDSTGSVGAVCVQVEAGAGEGEGSCLTNTIIGAGRYLGANVRIAVIVAFGCVQRIVTVSMLLYSLLTGKQVVLELRLAKQLEGLLTGGLLGIACCHSGITIQHKAFLVVNGGSRVYNETVDNLCDGFVSLHIDIGTFHLNDIGSLQDGCGRIGNLIASVIGIAHSVILSFANTLDGVLTILGRMFAERYIFQMCISQTGIGKALAKVDDHIVHSLTDDGNGCLGCSICIQSAGRIVRLIIPIQSSGVLNDKLGDIRSLDFIDYIVLQRTDSLVRTPLFIQRSGDILLLYPLLFICDNTVQYTIGIVSCVIFLGVEVSIVQNNVFQHCIGVGNCTDTCCFILPDVGSAQGDSQFEVNILADRSDHTIVIGSEILLHTAGGQDAVDGLF